MQLGANRDSGLKWFLSKEVLGLYSCHLSIWLLVIQNHIWLGFFVFNLYPVAINSLKCQPSAGKGCPCQHIWNAHSRYAPASTQPVQRGLLVCMQLLALPAGKDRERSFWPATKHATSTPQQEQSTVGTSWQLCMQGKWKTMHRRLYLRLPTCQALQLSSFQRQLFSKLF